MQVQDEDPNYITDDKPNEKPVAEDKASRWGAYRDEGLPTKHTEINVNGSIPEGEETPDVIIDEADCISDNPMAELLQYHYNFGHTPFSKLQQMAKRKIIPKHLAECNMPVCTACAYAKATKRNWRPKTAKAYKPIKPTKPGQVVSVNQLVSPMPGLIAQMTGLLTKKRYKYATVFVDQFLGLGFVYLQKEVSVEETVEAKNASTLFQLVYSMN